MTVISVLSTPGGQPDDPMGQNTLRFLMAMETCLTWWIQSVGCKGGGELSIFNTDFSPTTQIQPEYGFLQSVMFPVIQHFMNNSKLDQLSALRDCWHHSKR